MVAREEYSQPESAPASPQAFVAPECVGPITGGIGSSRPSLKCVRKKHDSGHEVAGRRRGVARTCFLPIVPDSFLASGLMWFEISQVEPRKAPRM